ncbi:MAG: nucleotidyltransferase [Flavobacteriales bacterium]|nr:nucleotidyltransferase [Flavobacteriales bacterium]
MLDIFNNYELQREELLARIAHELELDQTRKDRMEQAYNKVLEVLQKDEVFFKDLELELYAQGSVRTNTTVKPINREDFDLDAVLHIYDLYNKFDPTKIYNALVRVIEADPYYKTICEKKDRCIRLNFKNGFHVDILPGCMVTEDDRERIAIPEKKLKNWSSGNPKGFGVWFLAKAQSTENFLLKSFSDSFVKAEVEAEPLPDTGFYEKTPLQRSVQLVKRYRDIYFQDKDNRVSSIVITTLMGLFYNGEESIYETINNCLSKIKSGYNTSIEAGQKFKIVNPVDEHEVFTDSWTDVHYYSFYAFVEDLYFKWEILKKGFDTSGEKYVLLFGEKLYKNSLQTQLKSLGKYSKDAAAVSSGLVLNEHAMTDKAGNINQNQGVKNERHHNFGGENA